MRSTEGLGWLLVVAAVILAAVSGWPPPSTTLWASSAMAVLGIYILYSAPKTRMLSSRELVTVSFSAAVSTVLGFLPPFFQVPWMMKIDLVAVPWAICWFSLGTFPAMLSALISVPIVGFLEPFGAGGWIGGISKFLASIWTFLIPAAIVRIGMQKEKLTNDNRAALFATGAVVVARSAFMTVFNYYLAIPWYYGIRIDDFIALLDRGLGLLRLVIPVSGLTLFVCEMSFWNSIQAVVEFWVALLLYRALRGRFGRTT
ncbi:MAG TPA: ECF transporter S component [Thermoproteota archaeon]|nr:ECF transporter S component [Thermoproteota archaeon]